MLINIHCNSFTQIIHLLQDRERKRESDREEDKETERQKDLSEKFIQQIMVR